MRLTRLLAYAMVTILMVFGGCNGSNEMTSSAPTQLNLGVTPNPAFAGSPIVFKITAFNDHLALKSVSIDYTSDGTWDDTRTFDRSSVTEAFGFTYGAPGTYNVRVEVKDANNAPVTTTVPVIVLEPAVAEISVKMYGTSARGGECGAMGPPATCMGCSGVLLGTYTSAGESRLIGTFPEGAPVRVSQNFVQNPYTGVRTLYDCQFLMVLVAKTQLGGQHEFAAGQCSTTSTSSPGHLSCNIDIRSVVTATP